MSASLPWYPGAAAFWKDLWHAMRPDLPGAPAELDWPADLAAHWASPDIWITQTCAPLWKARLRDRLYPVGSFDFGLSAPGTYRSAIVTRQGDRRPLHAARWRVAVNEFESQSGWGALNGVPRSDVLQTGSHAASMDAVAAGQADLAAIDGVTWRLSPHPELRVRAWTRPTPAPPVLTSDPARIGPLRDAIRKALTKVACETIGLRDFVALDAAYYATTPRLPPLPRCICIESAA